jgi:aspartyl-tRNA(Asn)/glutamyl-tRNA(Gln) amidotransferase subunit C
MMSEAKVFDVESVADLARLELTDAEKSSLSAEMEGIVAYVDMLSELNVDGIEPTAHAAPLTNVLRDDLAVDSFPRDPFIANAPDSIDDELIKVPKVIDES